MILAFFGKGFCIGIQHLHFDVVFGYSNIVLTLGDYQVGFLQFMFFPETGIKERIDFKTCIRIPGNSIVIGRKSTVCDKVVLRQVGRTNAFPVFFIGSVEYFNFGSLKTVGPSISNTLLKRPDIFVP